MSNDSLIYFNDDQMQDIVEIIGDKLSEEIQKDSNLHYADVYQAAVDIATLLSGSSVFLAASFEVWRLTNTEKVKEIIQRAKENGFTLKEQVLSDIITCVANYLGRVYPPIKKELE